MLSTSTSLLQRLRAADNHAAWERFVRLYTPLLYHWARRAGLQEQDADDLVQDVLLTLLHKLPEFTYQPQQSFRAWLRTVTLNKWRDRLKRRGLVLADGDLDPAVSDGVCELEEEEYRQYLTQRVLHLIRADFQESTWKACWELVVAGRPAADIAAELRMTPGAVHAARFRVLARLRQELDGLLD
jgi:RNA polymerase sigma-70 factor (ECF subfamily)